MNRRCCDITKNEWFIKQSCTSLKSPKQINYEIHQDFHNNKCRVYYSRRLPNGIHKDDVILYFFVEIKGIRHESLTTVNTQLFPFRQLTNTLGKNLELLHKPVEKKKKNHCWRERFANFWTKRTQCHGREFEMGRDVVNDSHEWIIEYSLLLNSI